jgi:hypothetical protein
MLDRVAHGRALLRLEILSHKPHTQVGATDTLVVGTQDLDTPKYDVLATRQAWEVNMCVVLESHPYLHLDVCALCISHQLDSDT